MIPLGSLYTWGDHPAGLGWKLKNPDDLLSLDVPNTEKPYAIPQRIDHFDNNVSKVAMGPYHTAVITSMFNTTLTSFHLWNI